MREGRQEHGVRQAEREGRGKCEAWGRMRWEVEQGVGQGEVGGEGARRGAGWGSVNDSP